jgi:hypothetical protein
MRTKSSEPRPFATALALAQHLAARWFELSVTDAGKLSVRPARWLTDTDRLAIRTHRDALIALVRTTPAASCPRLRFFRFDPCEAFALREHETVQ